MELSEICKLAETCRYGVGEGGRVGLFLSLSLSLFLSLTLPLFLSLTLPLIAQRGDCALSSVIRCRIATENTVTLSGYRLSLLGSPVPIVAR